MNLPDDWVEMAKRLVNYAFFVDMGVAMSLLLLLLSSLFGLLLLLMMMMMLTIMISKY